MNYNNLKDYQLLVSNEYTKIAIYMENGIYSCRKWLLFIRSNILVIVPDKYGNFLLFGWALIISYGQMVKLASIWRLIDPFSTIDLTLVHHEKG